MSSGLGHWLPSSPPLQIKALVSNLQAFPPLLLAGSPLVLELSPHVWALAIPGGFGVPGLHPLLGTCHIGEGSPLEPGLPLSSPLIPTWTLATAS